MSHYKLKKKYNTEGAYASIEEKTLYAHHNLSCDVVLFYDEDGEFIMAVPDTIENNLLDAINKLYTPFDENGNLEDGIKLMSLEEIEKIKQ